MTAKLEECGVAELAAVLAKHGVDSGLCAVLQEQEVDGIVLQDIDHDTLRDLGVAQWGRRQAVLRARQRLQADLPPLRIGAKDSIPGVIDKLARLQLKAGSAHGDEAIALVKLHALDGPAMADLDKATLVALAKESGMSFAGTLGPQIKFTRVCEDFKSQHCGAVAAAADIGHRVKPRARNFWTDGGSSHESESQCAVAVRAERLAAQRADFRVVWPNATMPAFELLGLDSIGACQNCGADRATKVTLPPRAEQILQIAAAGSAHWRRFLADAPMTECDMIGEAVRALQAHGPVPEGAGDMDGPYLPEGDSPPVIMAKPDDEGGGCGCEAREVVESLPPTKYCVLRGPVAVPTIKDPSDSAPLRFPCFLRGVAGKALVGGSAFLGRRGQHTDRQLLLLQGAHSVVFAQCTVVCGIARAASDASPDACARASVCSLTHCVFYDCTIIPSPQLFESPGQRSKWKGGLFVHGCLFIKCHWRPRAFSDWVVRDNCFINSTFLLRNKSMGDMTNNLVCAQAQQVEEGRLFIEEQKSRVRYRDNIFRGSIRTLGNLFFEDIANTYDVLPTGGLLRIPWSELESPTVIASGSFGKVYKARHRTLSRPVAVKELMLVTAHMDPNDGECGATARACGARASARAYSHGVKRELPRAVMDVKLEIEEMMHEIEVMQGLHRLPNLIAIYGCGVHDEKIFMCMEYATHGCLQQLLRYRPAPRTEGWLKILHDVAVGLWSIHLRSPAIVHMDCRSSNVFVTDGPVCKLGDFGGAVPEAEKVKVFPVRYSDPELLDVKLRKPGEPPPPPPCAKLSYDIWSLGVLAWEVLEQGKLPYTGLQLSDAVKRVHRGMRLTCPQVCAPELWERYGSRCFAPAAERPSAREYAEDVSRQIGAIAESMAEAGALVQEAGSSVDVGARALQEWISDESAGLPTEVSGETEFNYVDTSSSFLGFQDA
eukprot:TRINITY_DN593_c0_g3_i1.p1 TRINITY_DN593_c0_g3~~TRINITY_DN593_c0_g3_i1.p1  ORF type:complete len:943 (+),score=229.97 TRINITY_DN593_c0_g3_i1:53-2881(+)